MERTVDKQAMNSPLPLVVVLGALSPLVLAGLHVVNGATVQHRLFDMREENNLPTWMSSSLFIAAAVVALFVSARLAARLSRYGWLSLALLALAMSIDETASVHEIAGNNLGAQATLSLTQPTAAAVVVVGLVFLAIQSERQVRRLLLLGCLALVVSQLTASIGGLLTLGTTKHGLEVLEECTETWFAVSLLAASVVATGQHLTGPRLAVRSAWAWWGASQTPQTQGLATAPEKIDVS